MTLKFAPFLLLTIFFATKLLAEESIVGIGVTLGKDHERGEISITGVVPAGPADKAGIKAGWVLQKIEDVTVRGMTVSDCVASIRGKPGSTVTLELIAEDNKTKRLRIPREKITIVSPGVSR